MALRLRARGARLRILGWDEALRGSSDLPRAAAATIGVFDGLHLGHAALVRRVVEKAPGLVPVAFTFKGNPKRQTGRHAGLADLFSLRQRLEALDAAGLALCVLIDFSGNFSKLAGSEFVSILVESFGVRSFVIGSDFRCGYRHSTDAPALRLAAGGLGAETDIVDPVSLGGSPVSSSRIRAAVTEGRTDLALAMLGRPYTVDLRDSRIVPVDGNDVVSLAGLGVAVPREGIYGVTLDYGTTRADVRATVRGDGTLSWPSAAEGQGPSPRFAAFGTRIA